MLKRLLIAAIVMTATIATHTIVVSCLLVNGPQPLPAFDGLCCCRISALLTNAAGAARLGRASHGR